MKQVTTDNSVYRVDPENKRIMRLTGVNAPTNHFSPDNTWKEYQQLSDIEIGKRLFVFWTGIQYTRTSKVVSVVELL